jgi:glycosyltransferase involved in cell wall biosynthesis
VKVLFVHFGDDWIAGSEVALLELMRALTGMNVQPHLWCNAPAMQQAAQKIGVPVDRDVFAHAFDYSSPRFSPSAYFRLVRRGKQLIAQSGAQIVHCNSAAPAQWMLPACRGKQTPLLINLHSRYHRRSRYVLGVHLADRVVAVSSSIAAPLLADGMEADRIGIVYNGFDERRLLLGSAAGLRAELGIPADARVGIVAGSLIRRKGHDLLFQAMRTGAAGAFHLLVVGDGPERESYQKQSCGLPVHFLGHRDDVGPIMRDAADFLVAPSRQEAFGRVIIEAALAGIPAIGTRVDGIPEAILEDQTGLLVPPESPEALAAAIARLSADEELRHRMGAAAAQRAHALFTIERVTRMMIDEYRGTISRYRSSTGSGLRRLRPYLGLMGAAPQESAA